MKNLDIFRALKEEIYTSLTDNPIFKKQIDISKIRSTYIVINERYNTTPYVNDFNFYIYECSELDFIELKNTLNTAINKVLIEQFDFSKDYSFPSKKRTFINEFKFEYDCLSQEHTLTLFFDLYDLCNDCDHCVASRICRSD